MRTGDTDLHFFITTVQDGWSKSAFLTRACFPCTIHLIMQYIEPVSEWSCWRMFIETWPHWIKPQEHAFKQFKSPHPQCVKYFKIQLRILKCFSYIADSLMNTKSRAWNSGASQLAMSQCLALSQGAGSTRWDGHHGYRGSGLRIILDQPWRSHTSTWSYLHMMTCAFSCPRGWTWQVIVVMTILMVEIPVG